MNDRKRMIEKMVVRQYEIDPPKTQQDCCAMAARVSVAINGPPLAVAAREVGDAAVGWEPAE